MDLGGVQIRAEIRRMRLAAWVRPIEIRDRLPRIAIDLILTEQIEVEPCREWPRFDTRFPTGVRPVVGRTTACTGKELIFAEQVERSRLCERAEIGRVWLPTRVGV